MDIEQGGGRDGGKRQAAIEVSFQTCSVLGVSQAVATMIPECDPLTIENNGERLFYQACGDLPKEYTCLYSYKYKTHEAEKSDDLIGEADFVIVHPALGYAVVEVKQGNISFHDGAWHEFKGREERPLKRDPVEQAKRAMYAILHAYQEKAKTREFPLWIRFAVAFPESSEITGILPGDLDPNGIFLFRDLENLEPKLKELFGAHSYAHGREAVDLLLHKVLAPSFKVFAKLDDRIGIFHATADRVLTEEQERILEETELDKRKIFFGLAGTGKTLLALEKARRLAAQGKRVFLTCFNRNLAKYLATQVPAGVVAHNFQDYLSEALEAAGKGVPVPETQTEKQKFFNEELPGLGFDHFADLPEAEKFDCLLVDEGQDFQEAWFDCLESMVKPGGEVYVFADPYQAIFNKRLDALNRFPVSKHRLTRNLRNSDTICEWISGLLPGSPLKAIIRGGEPVVNLEWESSEEEKRLIEKEIGRLVSQGLAPGKILILSPNVKEKSCLANTDRIKEWTLGGIDDVRSNCLRFATIRSFKGLEADVVFLIGLKPGNLAVTGADVYVGGSRARFLLYVFKQKGTDLTKLTAGVPGAAHT